MSRNEKIDWRTASGSDLLKKLVSVKGVDLPSGKRSSRKSGFVTSPIEYDLIENGETGLATTVQNPRMQHLRDALEDSVQAEIIGLRLGWIDGRTRTIEEIEQTTGLTRLKIAIIVRDGLEVIKSQASGK